MSQKEEAGAKIVKVRRVIEYEGTPEWVSRSLAQSYVRGEIRCGDLNVLREISSEEVREHVDLSRTDEYPDRKILDGGSQVTSYLGGIPPEDIETCLKVLRTLRNLCLGPRIFDAVGAVGLSHAHAKIVEMVKNVGGDEHATGQQASEQDSEPYPEGGREAQE